MNELALRRPDSADFTHSSQYLTKQQVARYLNVSVRTVDSLMRARKLPFIKLTRKLVRFRRQDVDEYLARNFRINAIGE